MVRLTRGETLDGATAATVTELIAAATAADGVAPASEDVRLTLRPGIPARGVHIIATEPAAGAADQTGEIVGYAHLADPAGPADAGTAEEPPERTAELLVRPDRRRRGIGTALLAELLAAGADARLAVWAHGDRPGAAELAARAGLRRDRVLWLMRRGLAPAEPSPPVPAPGGVSVRTFVVGRDEQRWLELNALAFAHHPEQGDWTAADLAAREAEPWFDPAGFFLAERAGKLIGFHWTKVDRDTSAGGEPGELVGEVYVLGVDPGAAGGGLGRALTGIGLRHLRSRGVRSVILYVDDSNTAALRLYEAAGFTRAAADVSYVSPGPARPPTAP
jgi:mycothiol synthase